jgi:UPF0271 protein
MCLKRRGGIIPNLEQKVIDFCSPQIRDPSIVMETVKSCRDYGVKIGAHRGLSDLQGFGRREIKLSAQELTAMTIY